MEYSIRALAELAGVSARTLRYYDEIGLLKPLYVTDAGYRFYGENEVMRLQQILFYRERGFDLKTIRQILSGDSFDIMHALEEHLLALEKQKKHVDSLILTVKQTIHSMKGDYQMSNKEKFEAFKKNLIEENEKAYGAEIRQRHGDAEIDASNQKLLDMTEEEFSNFQALGERINALLKEYVTAGMSPEDEAGREITLLHREWLCKTWKQYSPQAHSSLAAAYTADKRFTQYYDKEVSGCAAFLEAAIRHWAEQV